MYHLNIIDLAIKQTLYNPNLKTDKELYLAVLDNVIKIRKWLDKHPVVTKEILEGRKLKELNKHVRRKKCLEYLH